MTPGREIWGDPANDRTSESSSDVATRLTGQGPERATQREADDVLNRSAEERYDTPRRYEEESTDE